MSPEQLEFRERNKDSYQKDALFWIDLSSQRLINLNSQLLGFTAILLPLTASIVLSDIKLEEREKWLLVLIWVLLIISIVAGLIQICIDMIYFRGLSRDSSNREKIWSDFSRPIVDLEKQTKKLGQVKESSTHAPLIIQAIALVVGLVVLIFLAGFILFSQ